MIFHSNPPLPPLSSRGILGRCWKQMVTGSNPARSLGNLYSSYPNPIKIPSCFQAQMNVSSIHIFKYVHMISQNSNEDNSFNFIHIHSHSFHGYHHMVKTGYPIYTAWGTSQERSCATHGACAHSTTTSEGHYVSWSEHLEISGASRDADSK